MRMLEKSFWTFVEVMVVIVFYQLLVEHSVFNNITSCLIAASVYSISVFVGSYTKNKNI